MKITITGARIENKSILLNELKNVLRRFDGSRTVGIGDGERPDLASVQVYVTNDVVDAAKFIQED